MPLTDQQRNVLPALRAAFNDALKPSGVSESVEQRAQLPSQADLPSDLAARVEIAPPSPEPHPLILNTAALRKPERVPVYFFALKNQAETPVADTRVIFFIHGGGFIVGHPTAGPYPHFFASLLRDAATRAGDASKCVLIAPSYRVTSVPEHAFPAALQDLVAAYDYIVGKGYNPSNIVIAGDSAGGNHAVVLTHLILESGRLSPRGVVAIAPFANLVTDQLIGKADGDVISPSKGDFVVNTYLGDSGVARTEPLVSGAFLPFSESWPKTLLLVGTADQLLGASHEIARRLADVKKPVEVVEYDERPHGWWILPHIFPEDVQDATRRIARFVFDEHINE